LRQVFVVGARKVQLGRGFSAPDHLNYRNSPGAQAIRQRSKDVIARGDHHLPEMCCGPIDID
jgi:hypothetical protein